MSSWTDYGHHSQIFGLDMNSYVTDTFNTRNLNYSSSSGFSLDNSWFHLNAEHKKCNTGKNVFLNCTLNHGNFYASDLLECESKNDEGFVPKNY